jgi:hypothetical protein
VCRPGDNGDDQGEIVENGRGRSTTGLERVGDRARWRTRLPFAALAVAAAGLVGTQVSVVPPSAGASASISPAPFTAHGSIGQAYVLGARPGESLVVVNKAGKEVGHGTADRFGSLIVRTLAPGPGYEVRAANGSAVYGTPAFSVLSPDTTPPTSLYTSQHLKVGLNYLRMRTGITLAATLRLPSGKTLTQGPFPTVIEYTGYPDGPGTLLSSFAGSSSSSTPLAPTTSTAVGGALAPLLGFASVSVQMRGSGCSGGAFDLFGLPTTYDGYDAVQIVGSQPWVLNHKVGMVGISFSGISQMFVGGSRPPDLAAITPLSTTNDLYTTGFPGGIFNSGFAGSWLDTRVKEAQPATTPSSGADSYAKTLIADGTRQCLANQKLRLQTQNLEELLRQASHQTPALYDQRSPEMWAEKIDVPVFMAGAFEDEETGPQWPAIIPAMKKDRTVFVTLQNGTHVTSLGPGVLTRWLEFLDIYVADKVPFLTSGTAKISHLLYSGISATAPSETLPAIRFGSTPNVATARKNFRKQTPRVRVLFDNGGGNAGPGALQPVWTASFTAWPPPGAVVTSLDLANGGRLTSSNGAGGRLPATGAGSKAGTVSFRPNPTARPATDLPNGNVWAALPPYRWTPVTGTEGVGFISAPLRQNMVVVGPGSLNLELESTASDTDLQATVTDVYPTGKEMYVESGQLRASDRALTKSASTALQPVPTYLASTARRLPKGRFTSVRIPIDPMGHAFRKGDRIRVVISAPGGSKPAWSFATTFKTGGNVVDSIRVGTSAGASSSLVLPVIPGLHPPDPRPACPSLRGEPCRTYVPAGNGG